MSVITLSDRTSYENAGYTSFGMSMSGWDELLRLLIPSYLRVRVRPRTGWAHVSDCCLTAELYLETLMCSSSSSSSTWAMNGTQTWQLNAAAIGPNTDSEVAQRLISEEPMVSISSPASLLSCVDLTKSAKKSPSISTSQFRPSFNILR